MKTRLNKSKNNPQRQSLVSGITSCFSHNTSGSYAGLNLIQKKPKSIRRISGSQTT